MPEKSVKIRNVSPLGALEVPLLGRVVGADEIVEVSESAASRLLEQAENFAPVVEPKGDK